MSRKKCKLASAKHIRTAMKINPAPILQQHPQGHLQERLQGRLEARHPAAALLRQIMVHSRPGDRTRGWLIAEGHAIPVALGRGGIRADKREGDGGTPRGVFHPLRLWWRKDRHPRPRTALPVRPIHPDDGWCEAPDERRYNRPIRLRGAAAGDRLTRADHLYDFIVEIDHNTRPRIKGRGSAVFLHLARPGFAPTAGCVAMTRPAMLRLLARLTPQTRIVIE
jgi:L,D-peptidoglycan transpeptidase YkuD (ErfK/YbiS/YcfS/YnhG family)